MRARSEADLGCCISGGGRALGQGNGLVTVTAAVRGSRRFRCGAGRGAVPADGRFAGTVSFLYTTSVY